MKRKLQLFGYVVSAVILFTGCRRKIDSIPEEPRKEIVTVTVTDDITVATPKNTPLVIEELDLSLDDLDLKIATFGPVEIPSIDPSDESISEASGEVDSEKVSDVSTPLPIVSQAEQDQVLANEIRLSEDNTQAQIDEIGTIVGVEIVQGKIKITKIIKAPSQAIVIPSMIERYQVTTIASNAFRDVKVNEVELQQGIKKIESQAFYGNSYLIKVWIPNSVTSIGKNAFGNCSKLSIITVDEENENYALVDGVLYNKAISSLIRYPAGRTNETLMLPDTVVEIEDGAFSMSKYLCYIVFPSSLRSIGYEAFAGCTLLTIDIPQTIVELEAYAFADCYQLHTITIPEMIHVIKEATFSGCENVYRVNFLGNIDQISNSAFANCTSLNNVEFSGSLGMIGELSFAFCTSLNRFELPEGTVEISDMAFYACDKLYTIYIPESVSYYGYMVFEEASQVMIEAPTGSMAIEYAKMNGLKYREIDG